MCTRFQKKKINGIVFKNTMYSIYDLIIIM